MAGTVAKADIDKIVTDLRTAGVHYVCGSLLDSGGINRMKCMPVAKLARAARSGVGLSRCWATGLSNDHFTEIEAWGAPSTGDLRLIPDLSALASLAATPRWAWAPFDQYEQDGKVFSGCQRDFVKRMTALAAGRGLTLKMAYEIEWFTTRGDGRSEIEPIHTGPGYSSAAWVEVEELAADLLDALTAEAVGVETFHPEYAAGQMEVAFTPIDPLTAADWNVLFRHTTRSVSHSHGCRPSFSPVTIPGQPSASGCHLHFSLWDGGGANLFSGGSGPLEITEVGESFLAGVLREVPALTAIACPTVPSYERLKPQRWAGAYQCWGHENREAALRFVQGMAGIRGQNANMEFKAADCAAHPYLLVGAVIAAGLAGIEAHLSLPAPVSADPETLSQNERAAQGIRRLPQSLSEAADALAASKALRAAMGDPLFDATVAVRRAESEADKDKSLEELMKDHLWRF
jgi:glutamine synthetase